MPVDAEPAADGNVIVDLAAGRGVVIPTGALPGIREDTPDEPLYKSHFATCPQASEWRRRPR
jgi:hypothetical protein